MQIRIALWAMIFGLGLVAAVARADEEMGNYSYVRSDETGQYYARAIPTEGKDRDAGTIRVYNVQGEKDKLLTTYDWYAQEIALVSTSKGVVVIRFGPWPRGHKASADQLAIAFYLNGKLLKSYSMLDIAGKPDNVSASKSHYEVIKKRLGVRYPNGGGYIYDIQTTDDRTISFNPETGEIIPAATAK